MSETTLGGHRLAVLAARLDGIASSMGHTLLRSGRSAPVNRARDFSCCIVSAAGDLLVYAESIPIHVLGADLLARSLAELQPVIRPGDAFLHNSPYHGNTHAGDHVILVPVFDDDARHRATMVVKAHMADIGNSLPTTYHAEARDVYEEGAILFPCVRVQREGRDVEDVLRMCRLRIRVPEQWHGDYLAMVGAARVGERELLELAAEVGWDALAAFEREWLDYGERRMAAAIAALPEATAAGESTHDPLPGTPPEGVRIRSTVRALPDEGVVEVDLRDNPDNLPCGLNMTEATAKAAALIGVFNGLDPTIPKNGGAARRVRVLLREGCVAGIPRHPVSCSVATTNVADRIVNATQQAMAGLGEGVGMAEFGAFFVASSAAVSGVDPRSGLPFVNQIFLGGTAGAGGPFSDGWLTYLNAVNGGMCHLDSIEVAERFQPILVHERRVVEDSEGAGWRRGAPALRVEYGPLDGELTVAFVSDGERNPAQGVRGGGGTVPAWNVRRRADGSEERLPPSGLVTLAPGERVACLAQSGGGYGPPAAREPERVRVDVEDGLVTRERARAVYRVAIDERGEVDEAATASLRARA
ncbi:MAG: hydantoinase B/oxoprolinase family protein [Thermoleophilia bacterium]